MYLRRSSKERSLTIPGTPQELEGGASAVAFDHVRATARRSGAGARAARVTVEGFRDVLLILNGLLDLAIGFGVALAVALMG